MLAVTSNWYMLQRNTGSYKSHTAWHPRRQLSSPASTVPVTVVCATRHKIPEDSFLHLLLQFLLLLSVHYCQRQVNFQRTQCMLPIICQFPLKFHIHSLRNTAMHFKTWQYYWTIPFSINAWYGHAIVQAGSCCLLTTAAQVQANVRSFGISDG
jgi:hypothetical protein